MRCSLYGTVVAQPASGHVTAMQIFTNWVHKWFEHFESQKTTPASKGHAWCLPCCYECLQMLKLRRKGCFTAVSPTAKKRKGESPVLRPAVQHIRQPGETRNKASCFTLLRRITRLKCVNSEVRSFQVSHKGVPSTGSMAPCRSHHGNHTRQELILHRICRELNPMQT